MIKYIKPKIEEIGLDSRQAILQTCQSGGGYFMYSLQCYGVGTGMVCINPVRGTLAGSVNYGGGGDWQNMGS